MKAVVELVEAFFAALAEIWGWAAFAWEMSDAPEWCTSACGWDGR